MRIALLSYEYPPETGYGGIGTYTYYQAHALSRLGHEVHVFAGSPEPEFSTRMDGNVRVTRFHRYTPVERLMPGLGDLGLDWFKNRVMTGTDMMRAVGRELRRGRFDVIEMPECGGEGSLLNAAWDLPTVVRFHSPAELIMSTYPTKRWDRLMTAWIERLGIRGARALSSCSLWLADEVREKLEIESPITVIPNGIDLRRFDESGHVDVHDRFDLPRDHVKILFANRIEPRKGIHVVRDLLVPVLGSHGDVTLVLAGADHSGYIERELMPIAREHGFEDRIRPVGQLDLKDVRACVKQCEIFLLASIWENAPYSLLEAMSAGAGIVASDCGGVPEMIRHGIDGLIARTENADDFARALDRMIRQSSLRDRLGRSARQRAEARYSADRVALRSVEFYEWAVGSSARSTRRLREDDASVPTLEIGCDNWYQVWWLRGDSAGPTPVFARDADGRPALAQLGSAALAFVHSLLARVYWRVAGRADAPEAEFLQEFARLDEEVAAAESRGEVSDQDVQLGLPAATHPIFESEQHCSAFRKESWRVVGRPWFESWLGLLARDDDFLERANRLVSARWMLIEAARRKTSAGVQSDVLHGLQKTYRTVADHARVVSRDLEFIGSDPQGPDFAAAIDELGLHANLRRPKAFSRPKKLKLSPAVEALVGKSDGEPVVTVVIPSYRHEDYIESAVQSALDNVGIPLRVLVADDQSPDETVARAKAIDDARVDVRVNDENLGLGASLRNALASVETPFVAVLNSDDLFHPHRLARALERFADGSQTQLVATSFVVMDDQAKKLDRTTASMPDLGARAFEWVRWNERIQSAFESAGDRSSVEHLLRANHLVTSSNVVARTEWLRDRLDDADDLKYCLDWDLFLTAARADALAFVDEDLLGYRLHASNTVWFDESRDVDYLHEVHAVVARALQALIVEDQKAGEPPLKIRERIVTLLRDAFAHHGEIEASELVLALLGGRGDESEDPANDVLVSFASDSRASKRRARALGDLDVDPWLAASWLADLRKTRGSVHLASLLASRLESVEREVAAEKTRVSRLEELADDAEATRDRAVARRDAALHETSELQASLTAARAEIEELQEGLDTERERSATLEDRLARTQAHLDDKCEESDRLKADIASLQDRLRDTEKRRVTALQDARAEASVKYRDLLLRREIERRAMAERPEWKLARLLGGSGPVAKVAKTMRRLRVHGHVRGARALQNARPRREGRVVVALDDRFPPRDPAVFFECRDLVERGLDLRILAWGRGKRRDLPAELRGVRRRVSTLFGDAKLADSDRRRHADAVRDFAATVAIRPDDVRLDRAAIFTASAEALKPSLLLGFGLGEGSVAACAAASILDLPVVIRITGDDVERHADQGGDRRASVRSLLAACKFVVVDTQQTAQRVQECWSVPADKLRRSPPPVAPISRDTAVDGTPIASIGALVPERDLRHVVESLQSARRAGSKSVIEFLGEAELDGASVHVREDLMWQVYCNSGEELRYGGPALPRVVVELLQRASGLIESSADGVDRGLPWTLVQAFASEVPVLAARTPSLEGLAEDGAHLLFYDAGDVESLSAALQRFSDAAGRRTRASAARELHASWADARAEFVESIRSTLGISSA